MSACQCFRPAASFFFGFFNIVRGVAIYKYAYDIPLVTLILNIYGFVGLALFIFLAKVPFLAI